MKQLQFELWQECNSKCTFCYLGRNNCGTPDGVKITNMNNAIKMLSNKKTFEEYDTIAFIGGEFFQGQLSTEELRNKWFELMNLCNDALNNEIVDTIWINASLLIGTQPDFYKTLDLFDKKDHLWVLTSYDTMGRFHTQKMFDTWESHLEKIYKEYPEIHVNITSILTGDLVEKFLNDEIDLYKYYKKYGFTNYFKNPVQPYVKQIVPNSYFQPMLGNFFPTRHNMLRFFAKFLDMYGEEMYDRLISTDLRADEIRKNYNDDKRNIKFTRDRKTLIEYQEGFNEDLLPCGHNDIYCSYIDSNHCILCDKQLIKKTRG